MATRCSILINVIRDSETVKQVCLYKHWDGYPSEVLEKIKKSFTEREVLGDRDFLSALYSAFPSDDDLQLSHVNRYGKSGEDYLYEINTGLMNHKDHHTNISISVNGKIDSTLETIDGNRVRSK